MWVVSSFMIEVNRFSGALPETGLQAMQAVYRFQLSFNHIRGALPAIGLQSMRGVSLFFIR
eukprot:5277032-Amphidinium_carterae.1